MIEAIKKFLAGGAPLAGSAADAAAAGAASGAGTAAASSRGVDPATADLRVAACALLLELAHADDTFSLEEQHQIEQALGHHFELSAEEGKQLMVLAEERRKQAIDLYQFTRRVAAQYDEGQRTVLAEIMWRVVYADGQLSQHEEALMRKIGSLLDLKPGYLATARKRAAPQEPKGPPPAGPAEAPDPEAGA